MTIVIVLLSAATLEGTDYEYTIGVVPTKNPS